MRTCGIELKGNDLIMVILEGNSKEYKIDYSNSLKITLKDSINQEELKVFYKRIIDFFKSVDLDKVGIKARATKGRFAGGSVSFKTEGLIQTIDQEVSIIHSKTISSKIKDVSIDFGDLKKYQYEAMNLAVMLMFD